MQIPINVGQFALDTTGTPLRLAFIACNAMFSELFGIAGLVGLQLINYGTYAVGTDPTNPATQAISLGEPLDTAFPKINANFAALFAFLGSAQQEVIDMGGEVGQIIGQFSPVIGTGDPGRAAMEKIQNNFTYLYTLI